MDFTELSNDELAEAGRGLMAEIHARIDDLDAGHVRRKAERRAKIAHAALDDLAELAADESVIQPFDGTNKPPPP